MNSCIKNVIKEYRGSLSSAKWKYLRKIREMEKRGELSDLDKKVLFSNLIPSHITTSNSPLIARYSVGASFKVLMANFILEKRQYTRFSVAPSQNDKTKDAGFVNSLGFEVPHVYCETSDLERSLDYDECIVKPKRGASAKGVFLKEKDAFYHFFDKKKYTFDDVVAFFASKKINDFIIEEYVGGDGFVRDLKFYMFYGKVGVVLEVLRKSSGNAHCFYNSRSEVVITGRYKSTLFDGEGFSLFEKKCAETISQEIPSPFVRVDLLSNGDKFRVGEITAHPGGFDEFNQEWDFKLGKEFLAARSRLFEDLLAGKTFERYLAR